MQQIEEILATSLSAITVHIEIRKIQMDEMTSYILHCCTFSINIIVCSQSFDIKGEYVAELKYIEFLSCLELLLKFRKS